MINVALNYSPGRDISSGFSSFLSRRIVIQKNRKIRNHHLKSRYSHQNSLHQNLSRQNLAYPVVALLFQTGRRASNLVRIDRISFSFRDRSILHWLHLFVEISYEPLYRLGSDRGEVFLQVSDRPFLCHLLKHF
jgi:hypothetical protein